MKKTVFLLVLCSTMLASCSELRRTDDIITQSKVDITISSSANDESSQCDDSEVMPEVDTEELPEDEIILISESTNFAWGYHDNGTFIDSKGDVYTFSISEPDWDRRGENYSFREKLDIIRKNSKPAAHVDIDVIEAIYSHGMNISPDAEMKGEDVSFDAGEKYIKFCNNMTGEMIICSETGDWTGELDDENARAVISLTKRLDLNKIITCTQAFLYGDRSLRTENFGMEHTDTEGRFLIKGDKQLELFFETLPVDISQMTDSFDEYETGSYFYLVELANKENAQKCCGVLINDGNVEFALSDELFDTPAYCRVVAIDAMEIRELSYESGWQAPAVGVLKNDPDYTAGEILDVNDSAFDNVNEKYQMTDERSNAITTREKYEEFVDYCDKEGLVENGSVREYFEKNGEPDFDKVCLCVIFGRISENAYYERTEPYIYKECIFIGSRLVGNSRDDCSVPTVAFAFVPKTYLHELEDDWEYRAYLDF